MFIKDYWFGIPDNIDATFRYTDGKIYFFKDEKYYIFNEESSKVSIICIKY